MGQALSYFVWLVTRFVSFSPNELRTWPARVGFKCVAKSSKQHKNIIRLFWNSKWYKMFTNFSQNRLRKNLSKQQNKPYIKKSWVVIKDFILPLRSHPMAQHDLTYNFYMKDLILKKTAMLCLSLVVLARVTVIPFCTFQRPVVEE